MVRAIILGRRFQPYSQFHQRFTRLFFVQKMRAKNPKPKIKWKKAAQRLSYEKHARQMLMKLTPSVT